MVKNSKTPTRQAKKKIIENKDIWMINNKLWNYIFIVLSCLVFVSLLFVATRSGVTGDEFIDGHHGKYSLNYYMEGDTTFLHYNDVKELNNASHQKYYGVGYEILPAIFVKYFNLSQHEYLIRHILCALFGFLFMFFAAITAREIKDWFLACITLLIMALTPVIFGLSMFATKDIPMAAGYAIAIFAFIRIVKRLPSFKWWEVALGIVGIAIAVSVRIGGLLLVFYYGIAILFALMMKKNLRVSLFTKPYIQLWKCVAVTVGSVLAGSFIGLCFYPNFFIEGFSHIKAAFSLVSDFQQRIPVLYEGKSIDSVDLPGSYLIKSYFITIPLFALGGFLLFFFNIKAIWRTIDKTSVLLLLFTVFFPVLFIFLGESNVYNGWRHTTFIYSSFAILSAMGIYQTFFWIKGKKAAKIWRCVFFGVFLLFTVPVVVWMVKNYKYCYSYYNIFVDDPYLKYDLDYFETASTLSLDWLMENDLKDNKDTIKIATRNANVIYYAQSREYNLLKFEKISYRSFAQVDADYVILPIQFTPVNVLKTAFPPKGTIHIETIGGKPICVVVKKNKLDTRGIKAIQESKIDEGMKLLEESYAYDPANFSLWFWLGYGYFQQQNYQKSIDFLNSYVNFWPVSEQVGFTKMHIGASYVNLQQYDQGIKTLNEASSLVLDEPNKQFINAHLAIAYFNKQDYQKAIIYFNMVINRFPHLRTMLYQAYVQTGDYVNANRILNGR